MWRLRGARGAGETGQCGRACGRLRASALASCTPMSGESRNVQGGGRRPYRQVARASAARATRERVLEAAEELLRERMPEAVTLDAVARRARTTVPTVLRHFAGKEALVAAALAA